MPAPAGLQFEHPERIAKGYFQFQVRNCRDRTFDLEVSDDLLTWRRLRALESDRDPVTFCDETSGNVRRRFYRARCDGGAFSQNVVGFLEVTAVPGFTMLANPFHSNPNTVAGIFVAVPDGTAVLRFSTETGRLRSNVCRDGKWTHCSDTLAPGEGIILFNPTHRPMRFDFVGEIRPGSHAIALPRGFSICSSLFPVEGKLDGEIGLPLSHGDVVHMFDPALQKYAIYAYPSEAWTANPPVIRMGEAFWIGKAETQHWVREFFLR